MFMFTFFGNAKPLIIFNDLIFACCVAMYFALDKYDFVSSRIKTGHEQECSHFTV